MATTTLSRALAECLDAMKEGESLTECLERFPEHEANLRPLLEIAQALQHHQADPAPTPHFLADLKDKLTEEPNRNRKGGGTHRKKR